MCFIRTMVSSLHVVEYSNVLLGTQMSRSIFHELFQKNTFVKITSKKGLQRPAARYDGIGKIGGGGYGFLVEVVGVVVVVVVV